jgi:rhodanese-related sulfurtransferase
MPISYKDLVAEARAAIDAVSPEQAAEEGSLILDVREPEELERNGRIGGAVNVPRGLVELRADPESPSPLPDLTERRGAGPVDVLCASGGRAALVAATLKRMGYDARLIEGGLDGWEKAGLPVER